MKKLALLSAVALTAVSVMAKPSVSKVSAKVSGDNLNIAYTLTEKGYDPEEGCRMVEAQLFASQSEATAYFKANYQWEEDEEETEAEPFGYLDFDSEDAFENGSHNESFVLEDYIGLTVKEMKSEFPTAVLAIFVADDCEEGYSMATARVDYSAVSSVSPLALRLYKKSQTLTGICETEEGFSGTVSLKLGAINKKTGAVKVSATYAPFSGKKLTATQTVVADEDGLLSGALAFKDFGGEAFFSIGLDEEQEEAETLTFLVEEEEGLYNMRKAQVGGALDADSLSFSLDMNEEPELDSGYELLDVSPDGAEILVTKGTKWAQGKAPTIKYKKIDGEYELLGLYDDDKPNVASLKLTYTAKTGVFKGSFYLYASNECCIERGAPKLKKYKVTVSGTVIDGIGYGSASVKIGKKSYVWNVSVE